MPADIVLKNANVITLDAAKPAAGLVAVSGGRISLVADNGALPDVAGVGTRVIDCEGRAVIPGFNDAHLHLFSMLRRQLGFSVGPAAAASIVDIKNIIRQEAATTPPGAWLSGFGFNEFHLKEKRYPNRRDLDEAAPEHPVVLSHHSLHGCVLNSRALELAGIGRATPEPPGARIERDLATGEPNGILYEMLSYLHDNVLPPFTAAATDKALAAVNEYLLSHGVTSVQDATHKNDYARWQAIAGFQQAGKLRSRVGMMVGHRARREFLERGMATGAGDDKLRLGAVKLMLTGKSGQRQDALNELVLACHNDGFQVAFHAVEEEAVAAATTALEFVDKQSPVTGRRHRIEHCAECPPPLLERLAKIGAVIVTQPPFIYHSGERYLATVDKKQLPWLYRIGAPLAAGIVVAGSSDSPVVPAEPLTGIYAAVTRRAAGGQTLVPEDAVTPRQALALYTANAACASGEEGSKGALVPGKLADMAVLSANPAGVPADEIMNIKVAMTIIGGEVVWEG